MIRDEGPRLRLPDGFDRPDRVAWGLDTASLVSVAVGALTAWWLLRTSAPDLVRVPAATLVAAAAAALGWGRHRGVPCTEWAWRAANWAVRPHRGGGVATALGVGVTAASLGVGGVAASPLGGVVAATPLDDGVPGLHAGGSLPVADWRLAERQASMTGGRWVPPPDAWMGETAVDHPRSSLTPRATGVADDPPWAVPEAPITPTLRTLTTPPAWMRWLPGSSPVATWDRCDRAAAAAPFPPTIPPLPAVVRSDPPGVAAPRATTVVLCGTNSAPVATVAVALAARLRTGVRGVLEPPPTVTVTDGGPPAVPAGPCPGGWLVLVCAATPATAPRGDEAIYRVVTGSDALALRDGGSERLIVAGRSAAEADRLSAWAAAEGRLIAGTAVMDGDQGGGVADEGLDALALAVASDLVAGGSVG